MSEFCTACGAPLQENVNFCTGCGAPVINQAPGKEVEEKIPPIMSPGTSPMVSPETAKKETEQGTPVVLYKG